FGFAENTDDLFVGKTLLHGDVLMWLMKTLLTSGCTNQRGAGHHAITHSEGHINITVTAGVSRAFPEEPLDVVIGRADRAMYEGKQTGRNRCMFIDEQNVINRV
ncbi:diguanylate cyclase domain-containing protein, partial [Escherichia coli]|uniref:diguanylate cyclase domain-containing protein n=1 Tax=Escherichia coli TaxID=562 RepID=UPI002033BA30